MAWDYCRDAVTRDVRSVVNDYICSHPRPDGLSDEQFAAHVLAQLFVVPVLSWHVERAARNAAHADEQAKEIAND